MERLTTSQIQDFNNPLAFARDRSRRVGQNLVSARSSNTLRTGDIEESYRLVTGASARLETLAGNLQTMLGLAKEGQRIRGNGRKLQEVYGKLRSLSAGFDQVVEAIQFKDTPVFTGKNLFLSLGPGSRPINVEASKLLTYGEDSLNLSESEPTAKATIRYGLDDIAVNDAYGLLGLDIDEARYIPGSNGALELEDGKYKVRITYLGADSSVEILTQEGGVIEKQEGVDLSGSGREWVDFDAGVRLSFAKEQILQSIDKYDFETHGPAFLTATLNYDRVDAHTLRTSEAAITTEKAEFLFDPLMTDSGGGTLKALKPNAAPISPGKVQLETGAYTLDVEYRGSNSFIRLSDSLGRLKGYQFGVDLSGEGTTKIDLGVGLSFEVENTAFSQNSTMTIPVNYERPIQPIEEFDFREYAKRIEAAMKVVEEEMTAMLDATVKIEEFNQIRNSVNTSGIPNVQTLNSAGALNILSQPAGGPVIFNAAATSARTSLLANQLFSTTTALPTQANQSPEALASLQKASANGIVGFFV